MQMIVALVTYSLEVIVVECELRMILEVLDVMDAVSSVYPPLPGSQLPAVCLGLLDPPPALGAFVMVPL